MLRTEYLLLSPVFSLAIHFLLWEPDFWGCREAVESPETSAPCPQLLRLCSHTVYVFLHYLLSTRQFRSSLDSHNKPTVCSQQTYELDRAFSYPLLFYLWKCEDFSTDKVVRRMPYICSWSRQACVTKLKYRHPFFFFLSFSLLNAAHDQYLARAVW